MNAYLTAVEEAKKRDHNKIGRELEYFTTVDSIGQGLPIMLPKGAYILGDEVLSASCHVTVVDMEVVSLELDTTSCVLFPNDKICLTATYEPSNASFPEISWSSSDEDVATVNAEGEVRAVNVGECTITVKEGRSGLTAQCKITIAPVEMTSLELSETNCRIEIGETHSIVASFEPDNVTFPELYWYSSDESVAIVTNGLVEAVGVGDCVIYVTNADNSLSAKCDVSVYVIEMTTISCLSEKVMEQYESFRLSADYEPMNATYGLRWHSSDESVATVDEFTGEVNCVGIGECDITISNLYSSAIASCRLTVIPSGTVENYLTSNISITRTVAFWGNCIYLVKNMGDKEVYLSGLKYVISGLEWSVGIEKYLKPGEEYETAWVNLTEEVTWTFEMYGGVQCTMTTKHQ